MGLTAWAEERQAKHDAWREIEDLKRQNAALVAELEARNAQIEALGVQSDEWRDVAARAISVLQLNGIRVNGEYYAKCLNEIRAEAAGGGYLQCLKDLGRYSEEDDLLTVGDWNRKQAYAERVKAGQV